MMPLLQTIFLLIFPREKRGAAMGLMGLVIAFAPAIGPTLSGWIVDSYDWRVLFLILIPIAVIDIILAFFGMKKVVKLTDTKIDFLSIVMSSIGFGHCYTDLVQRVMMVGRYNGYHDVDCWCRCYCTICLAPTSY